MLNENNDRESEMEAGVKAKTFNMVEKKWSTHQKKDLYKGGINEKLKGKQKYHVSCEGKNRGKQGV